MHKLIISPKALRQLKEVKKTHESAVNLAIEELKDDPLSGKPLKDKFTGRFAIRVGVYRIIYKVDIKDKSVNVMTVKHRAIVYQ